jgi:hypothetical protein
LRGLRYVFFTSDCASGTNAYCVLVIRTTIADASRSSNRSSKMTNARLRGSAARRSAGLGSHPRLESDRAAVGSRSTGVERVEVVDVM